MSDEVIDRLLDEIRLLSRDEWFAIARRAGRGGFGFSPMRQLQLRIRENPLTFGPKLFAEFVYGGVKQVREIPWPKPQGWKLTRKWEMKGWAAKKALDPRPYLRIDPLLDRWDALEAERPDHPSIARVVRDLIALCCKDLSDNDHS